MGNLEARIARLEKLQDMTSDLVQKIAAGHGGMLTHLTQVNDAETGKMAAVLAVIGHLLARADEATRTSALASLHVAYEVYMQAEPGEEFGTAYRALTEEWFPGEPWPC